MDKPKISSYITVIPQPNNRVLLLNQRTKQSHSIGQKEYRVLQLCDGEHDLQQIYLQRTGFSEESVERLVNRFQELGFLEDHKKKKFQIWNIKIGIIHIKRYPSKDNPIIQWMSRAILFGALPSFLLGISLFFLKKPVTSMILQIPTVCYLAIVIGSMAIHELAHACVAIYNGAFVSEMGFGLKVILPCLYTSVVGISKIQSKRKRMEVYAAGFLMNLWLVGIGYLGRSYFLGVIKDIFTCICGVNSILVIINLFAFIPLDGMYLLGELVDDPNINQNATIYLFYRLNGLLYKVSRGRVSIGKKKQALMNQELFSKRKRSLDELPLKKKTIYLCHGIISFSLFFLFGIQILRFLVWAVQAVLV